MPVNNQLDFNGDQTILNAKLTGSHSDEWLEEEEVFKLNKSSTMNP